MTDEANCGTCGNTCGIPGVCQQGTCGSAPPGVDEDEDGYSAATGDCNDSDAAIHPGAEDKPDGEFVDTNCDGIDGDVNRAVFVAPHGEDTSSGGTRDAPLRTIGFALGRAQAYGKDHVYVHIGSYNEQVVLRNGISVWGGFVEAPDGSWQRSDSSQTEVSWSGSTQGSAPTVTGVDLTSKTTVGDLAIEAGAAPLAGGSAYGVHCGNCSGLVLERNRITAGPGENGSPGEHGSAGLPGGTGGDGSPGADDDLIEAAGGVGGIRACSDGSRAGGDGGRGGRGEEYGLPGMEGLPYRPPPFGEGGAGGAYGDPGQAGSSGGAGADGGQGWNGAGGAGGAVVSGYWVGQSGSDGTRGQSGTGGGGGGGGGGQDPPFWLWAEQGTGNGAGGGGAGGCGGTPGKGGMAGGGSFGVFLVSSAGAAVRGNTLYTGTGGMGGAGGTGGSGGLGGLGGWGAPYYLDEVGRGGDGGLGGDGGRGGHGGGGAGGASFGVFTFGGAVTIVDNVYSIGGGGIGGSSQGNRGASGEVGPTSP